MAGGLRSRCGLCWGCADCGCPAAVEVLDNRVSPACKGHGTKGRQVKASSVHLQREVGRAGRQHNVSKSYCSPTYRACSAGLAVHACRHPHLLLLLSPLSTQHNNGTACSWHSPARCGWPFCCLVEMLDSTKGTWLPRPDGSRFAVTWWCWCC